MSSLGTAAKVIKGAADAEGTVSFADGLRDYAKDGNVAAATAVCAGAFAATLTPVGRHPTVLATDAVCTGLLVNEGADWLRSKIPPPVKIEVVTPPAPPVPPPQPSAVDQIPK